MERKYNFIYSQLVEDEYDFVGQIAYSLYKQDKIIFIEKYIEENSKEIPAEELDKFHQMSCKEIVINAYRGKAEAILGEFINDTLEETIEEIKEETINNQGQILKEIIKPITPASKTKQFWTRILQSVVSNITITAILALIVLILYVAKIGFLKSIENIYNVKFTPDTTK